jgi:hypothetical protein
MDTSCWGNQGRDFGSLARSTRGRLVAVAIVLVALPVAPALAVEPGDLPNAFDGRAVTESAVGAPLVVVVHPVWQRGPTSIA